MTHVSRAHPVYVALGSPCPSRDAPAVVEPPSEALQSYTSQYRPALSSWLEHMLINNNFMVDSHHWLFNTSKTEHLHEHLLV